MPGEISHCVPGRITDHMPGEISHCVPGRITDHMPGEILHCVPGGSLIRHGVKYCNHGSGGPLTRYQVPGDICSRGSATWCPHQDPRYCLVDSLLILRNIISHFGYLSDNQLLWGCPFFLKFTFLPLII
jgi:hypothetical protein